MYRVRTLWTPTWVNVDVIATAGEIVAALLHGNAHVGVADAVDETL